MTVQRTEALLSRLRPAGGDGGDTGEGIGKVEKEIALCQEEIKKVGEKIEEVGEETKTMNVRLLPLENRILALETSNQEIPESLTLQVQSLRDKEAQLREEKKLLIAKEAQLREEKKLLMAKESDESTKLVEENAKLKAEAAGKAYLAPEVLSKERPLKMEDLAWQPSDWQTGNVHQVYVMNTVSAKCPVRLLILLVLPEWRGH